MALGFGFNKAKVLASAEKFVQQGKLQNAVSEYEKIVKEDPKDLTVLNTLGDLCVRIGQNEQAAQHFKKVGDHYAQDGFTVKAIAVYKKLTRLSPGNFDNVSRLAELYSQQGLFSDARAQYMQVADHLLKSGENNQGAKVLQKILELDPENTATQSKLADLYLKLGKKAEACKIYYSAAESLYARSSFDAADEALDRVLSIDSQNGSALLLRGMIAADSGDTASAIQHLEKVPDLDSRPDGLRALLRARVHSGAVDGAESVAAKLATVHNDLSGISALAQWYIGNQQFAKAVKLYDNYSDRFLAADKVGFEQTVSPLIDRVKDDPATLNAMSRLLAKMGNSSHSAEVMEMQAHTFAQKGDFKAARDLYKKLAEVEPDNPLHNQNLKQMMSKLGEDPTTRVLTPDEASQALMVEELEQGAPAVHQAYDPPTERAIEAALTDAELFVSYNVPAKAIPPLEAVLPLAPRDVTVNQRLATLYARANRYADAARACQLLSEVYHELGHGTESARYLEAAKNYSLRASTPPAVTAPKPVTPPPAVKAPAAVPPPPVQQRVAIPEMPVAEAVRPVHEIPAASRPAMEVEIPAEQPASTVQEFSFDVPDHLFTETPATPAHIDTQPIPIEEMSALAPAVETRAEPAPSAAEADGSNEWEDMLTVESAEPSAPSVKEPAAEIEVRAARDDEPAEVSADPAVAAAEKVQEAQYYISQQMWEAAKKAILDLTEIAPDAPEVSDLISAVSAGQSRAAAAEAPAPAAKVVSAPAPASTKPAVKAPPPPPVEAEPPAEEFEVEVEEAGAAEEFSVEPRPKAPFLDPFVTETKREPVSAPKPKPAPKPAAAAALEEIFRAPAGPAPAAPAAPASARAAEAPKPKPQPASMPPAAAEVPAPPPPPLPPQPSTSVAAPAAASQPVWPMPSPAAPAASTAASARMAPAAAAAPEVAIEEPFEDILVVPVEIEAPHHAPQPVAAVPAPPPVVTPSVPSVAPAPPPLPPLDSLLEDVLDLAPAPATQSRSVVEPKAPPTPRSEPAPTPPKPKDKTTEDILTDFVSDLEKSELADFVPRAKPDSAPPAREPATAAAKATPPPMPEVAPARPAPPAPPAFTPPVAAAASASLEPLEPLEPILAAPVNGDMHDPESASVLTDILSELQQENVEEAEAEEDPETHYNLGIAFKEMGLLDEAIGELQKVCHAMDRGTTFSQPIQAYTWLAQCLVDKGAPEAAVRWYKRALQLPRLDDGSRCAIYYDLALAYEASGDKKSALANLIEVYGSNIDFRDVASRIKALKS
jgi:tetratricopeptide (TPR) repeat protein